MHLLQLLLYYAHHIIITANIFKRIRDRDYEQIAERPEKTLADLARQADEADRRDRKAREREYGSNNRGTITGAARYVRRPAMSAEYLAAGMEDMEEEEEEMDIAEARRQHQQKAKAVKKKPIAADYLEYDEEEGSEAEEYDEDEEEEEEVSVYTSMSVVAYCCG